MTLQPGWQVHPQDPNYAYHQANPSQIVPIAQVMNAGAAPPAAAVPAAVVVPSLAAVPDAAQAAQLAAQYNYGTVTPEAIAEQAAQAAARLQGGGDFTWHKWPAFGPDGRVSEQFRILPPWEAGQAEAWLNNTRHRLYARLVPGVPTQRDIEYIDCPKYTTGGSGECAICDVEFELKSATHPEAAEFAKMMRGRGTTLWQALNLTRPEVNFKADPTGGAQMVIPTILSTGVELSRDITEESKTTTPQGGMFTHPEHGYPITITRVKTGPAVMNVDYKLSVNREQAGPYPVELWPVLNKLVDLSTLVTLRTPQEMAGIVTKIREFYLLTPAPMQAQVPAGYPGGNGYAGPGAAQAYPPVAAPAALAQPVPGVPPAVPQAGYTGVLPGVATAPQAVPLAVPPGVVAMPAGAVAAPPVAPPAAAPVALAPAPVPQALAAPVAAPVAVGAPPVVLPQAAPAPVPLAAPVAVPPVAVPAVPAAAPGVPVAALPPPAAPGGVPAPGAAPPPPATMGMPVAAVPQQTTATAAQMEAAVAGSAPDEDDVPF